MAVTYTKLWHILIDKGMKKKDLQQAADLTNHTMLKLRNNENIATETIDMLFKLGKLFCGPVSLVME